MRRWRRPHVADGGMAATGLMLASGALFGVGLLVHIGLGARVRLDSYVVLSVAMVVVWRLHRIGLYTGDHGVRICRFGRTRVLP